MAEIDIFSSNLNTAEVQDVQTAYEDSRERFIELVKEQRHGSLDSIESDIAEADMNYQAAMRNARNYIWEKNDLTMRRDQLKQIEENRVDNFEQEFDSLLQHDKVDALGIQNNLLLIKTNEIEIKHPDTNETRPLGEFELHIPLSQSRARYLQIFNRTNARTDEGGEIYHHPHIVEDDACFGALEEQLTTALSQGEIGGAFELILTYLQSFNPDDERGVNWELWS